jgi:hypothetical protein
MEKNTHPTHSKPGVKNLFVLWVIFGMIGAALGVMGYFIAKLDYFVKWEIFATAPQNAVQIMGGGPYQVFVRTGTDQTLSCNPSHNGCWVQANYSPEGRQEPCNYNAPAFSPITHPPEEVIDCIKIQLSQQGGGYSVQYLLDNQGFIWRWLKVTSEYEVLLIPIFALLGAGMGIVVGTIIWLIRRLTARHSMV